MPGPKHHVMDVELIAERETMRYHCPVCERCVEDGPAGLRVLHRGDPQAMHRGGSLAIDHEDIVIEPPAGPLLH